MEQFLAEIPGSLVLEPKHRYSLGKNWNRLGKGTDISAQVVLESESEPGFQLVDQKLWNRCEHKEILLVKDWEPKH